MKFMTTILNENGSIKTIILAIIFFAMLGATIHQQTQQRLEKERIADTRKTPILTEFKRDEVHGIEIYELLSKTVIRKRDDDQWWVGYTNIMPNMTQDQKEAAEISIWDMADQDAVRQLIDAVQNSLANWEVVSTNREKRIDYRIGPLGSEFKFKNEAGEEIACINVGEKAADFTGTYVAKCKEDEIYKVPGILEYVFKREPNEWRTKVIHDLEKENIIKLEIQSARRDQPVIIEKDDDGNWIGTSPRQFIPDGKRVDALLTSFSFYRARGFPERIRESVIENVELTIIGTMDDEAEFALEFGTRDESPEKLVRSTRNNIIYTAGDQDVDNLDMDADMLSSTAPDDLGL